MSRLDRLLTWWRGRTPPCPRCGSNQTDAVTVPGTGRAFDRPIDFDGPAYGCTACGLMWGRWGDEFADGE